MFAPDEGFYSLLSPLTQSRSRTAMVDQGLTKAILAFEMRLRVGTSHRALKSDPFEKHAFAYFETYCVTPVC
ncbi:hypothetical protein HZ326_30736 [Fusarium oxysporum f. sp. albedinis]|nr:hypothetical protein HZ326_30736 [Fusarium oxysporum f. sp. albedinis]